MAVPLANRESFEQISARLRDSLSDIMAQKRIEISPIIEDVDYVTKKNTNKQDLFNMLKSFLQNHLTELCTHLESYQADILKAYTSKWKLFHLSLKLILVCFDRLNQQLSGRNQYTKTRLDITTVKLQSRYAQVPTKTPGEATEIEKCALSLWRTIIFEHFQSRLLKSMQIKLTEERDATFNFGAGSGEATSTGVEAISGLTTSPAVSSAEKDANNSKNTWLTMGGDNLVSELVESVLKLGDAVPATQKMALYESTVETLYVALVNDYYGRESAAYTQDQGITAYISLALARLHQEDIRVVRYLHPSSKPKVTTALHQVLISAHKPAMLSEFEQMLRQDRKLRMHALYTLMSRLENGCEELKQLFYSFILETSDNTLKDVVANAIKSSEASAALKSASTSSTTSTTSKRGTRKSDRGSAAHLVTPASYVEAMTQLHTRFTSLVADAFDNDPAFITSMDRAYKNVTSTPVADDPTLGPELMARYCDGLLRKGAVSHSESELDAKLQEVVTIFKYVDDKDIFQNYYARLLAKRLISGSSISEDTERAMIGLLKPLCSNEFTLRVQRMFTDIHVSKDTTERFHELLANPASYAKLLSDHAQQSNNSTSNHTDHFSAEESNQKIDSDLSNTSSLPPPSLDFSVLVLTTGSWPMQETQHQLQVPRQIAGLLQTFAYFYDSIHTGRKLNWLYNLHRGELRIFYARKNYDIGATSFQIAALLAFEQSPVADGITLEQFTSTIGVSESEAIALVKNLLDCKLILVGTEATDPDASSSTTTTDANNPSSMDAAANHQGEEHQNEKPPVASGTSKKSPSFQPGTRLKLNTNFANKKLKFRLPPPAPTEAAKAAALASAKEEIDGDRTQYLQAIIVRTMKTRKSLGHTQLVQEVLDQCKSRFKASVPFIKRQIDSLIEMEYLTRSKEKADVYLYCA